MTHKIHQGDALEILKTMPDQSVDMILTGPPYYGFRRASDDVRAIGYEATREEYLANLLAVFEECGRVIFSGGLCAITLGCKNIAKAFIEKIDATNLMVQTVSEISREEYLILCIRDGGPPSLGPIELYGINSFSCAAAMSPLIVEKCITKGCPEGGTVLDPFAGTGTTLSVAVSMGRNAIGIEIAPSQIALIEKRMELLDTQVLERR